MIYIRDVVESDFESIVKLNDTEVQQTNEMSFDHLRLLIQMSSYCKVATVERQVAAFLIALREGALYENDNYRWFSSRFQNFLYVDRIVVGSNFSGHKIGSKLYTEMFGFARLQGIKTIACEYNIDPPNLPSHAFHDKFGFKELGTQWVASGARLVSLQVAET